MPTVPSGRAAPGDELLPAECDAAVAAVARLDTDFRLVDEHGGVELSAVSGQLSAVKGEAEG